MGSFEESLNRIPENDCCILIGSIAIVQGGQRSKPVPIWCTVYSSDNLANIVLKGLGPGKQLDLIIDDGEWKLTFVELFTRRTASTADWRMTIRPAERCVTQWRRAWKTSPWRAFSVAGPQGGKLCRVEKTGKIAEGPDLLEPFALNGLLAEYERFLRRT